MKKKIKDIKIVEPEDKLIILAEHMPPTQAERMVEEINNFLKSKSKRNLVIVGMQVCVIQKGAHVSFANIIEKHLCE